MVTRSLTLGSLLAMLATAAIHDAPLPRPDADVDASSSSSDGADVPSEPTPE